MPTRAKKHTGAKAVDGSKSGSHPAVRRFRALSKELADPSPALFAMLERTERAVPAEPREMAALAAPPFAPLDDAVRDGEPDAEPKAWQSRPRVGDGGPNVPVPHPGGPTSTLADPTRGAKRSTPSPDGKRPDGKWKDDTSSGIEVPRLRVPKPGDPTGRRAESASRARPKLEEVVERAEAAKVPTRERTRPSPRSADVATSAGAPKAKRKEDPTVVGRPDVEPQQPARKSEPRNPVATARHDLGGTQAVAAADGWSALERLVERIGSGASTGDASPAAAGRAPGERPAATRVGSVGADPGWGGRLGPGGRERDDAWQARGQVERVDAPVGSTGSAHGPIRIDPLDVAVVAPPAPERAPTVLDPTLDSEPFVAAVAAALAEQARRHGVDVG
jgi:hypothetical protein